MGNKFFKNVGNYTSFPGCFPKPFQNTLLLIDAVPTTITEFCQCANIKLLRMRPITDFMSILFQIF